MGCTLKRHMVQISVSIFLMFKWIIHCLKNAPEIHLHCISPLHFNTRKLIHVFLVAVPFYLTCVKNIFSRNQKTTDNQRHGIIFKRKTYVCGMLLFNCLSNAIPCCLSHPNSSCNSFQIQITVEVSKFQICWEALL